MPTFLRNTFMPLVTFLGLMVLVSFQNCSQDVGFDADPSARLATPVGVQNDPTSPDVSGTGGPIVQFNEVPTDSTNDAGAVVDFEVTTPTGTVTEVTCELNGTGVDCEPVDRVVIPPTGPGNQTFTVTATNSNNQTTTETITWVVFNRVVQRTKAFTVNVVGESVDIIINVDNSGSMRFEQESMRARISEFMAPFAGLDYHIAITTTSPIGNNEIWKPSLSYVDGKFDVLDDAGTTCIKSSVYSQAQAQTLLENNVVRGLNLLDDDGSILVDSLGRTWPEGNGWERGIFTTRRAFERDIAGQQADSSCIRNNDTAKHVILISDEDETTFEVDGNNNPVPGGQPLPDQDKSSGNSLRQYVAVQYGAGTVFQFHSIIVNPDTPEGAQCLASHGRAYGRQYAALSNATGGYIGSVCAADYASQLGQIGQLISDSNKIEALDCVSVANEMGSFGTVVNTGNNMEIATAYQFNGDKVEFAEFLPQGNYQITYYCFE